MYYSGRANLQVDESAKGKNQDGFEKNATLRRACRPVKSTSGKECKPHEEDPVIQAIWSGENTQATATHDRVGRDCRCG